MLYKISERCLLDILYNMHVIWDPDHQLISCVNSTILTTIDNISSVFVNSIIDCIELP